MVPQEGRAGDEKRVAALLLEYMSAMEHAEQLRGEIRTAVGKEVADRLIAALSAPGGALEAPAPGTSKAPVRALKVVGKRRGPHVSPASVASQIVALAAADPNRAWTYYTLKDAVGRPFDRSTLYGLTAAGRLRKGKVAGEFFGVAGAK